MIAYIRQVISSADEATCHRFCMVVGSLTLAACTLILSIAEAFGAEVSVALGVVTVPLAGLAGYNYVRGKLAEKEVAP